jgi:DnaJ-class molecular chaperone
MNAYEILECDISSSKNDLKQAYHRLLLKYHPDKCINDTKKEENLNKFLEIKTAFHILNDDTLRTEYDANLKQSILERNSTLSDFNQTWFSVKQDFNYDEHLNGYYLICRCSGAYFIHKNDLSNLLLQNDENKDIDTFFSLHCDTCSLSINVLII